MYKLFSVLALFLACCSASILQKREQFTGPMGIMEPVYRCGGVGTPIQLRVSECSGRCQFQPGKSYNFEQDFMPGSPTTGLNIKVEICFNFGFCHQIVNYTFYFVQPGVIYTARYAIVFDEVLSGHTVEFREYIRHTDSQQLEICASADIDIV